jgi:hypothetical protein
MLDVSPHQAAGLQGFMPQADLRLAAVASDANPGTGLEPLWQVCAILQRLGYPVVVLDGTAQETDESPGLIHLLRDGPLRDTAALGSRVPVSSLAVVPAGKGLDVLGRQAVAAGLAPLADLLPLFRRYGLLVLHAPATTLASLLTHTATVPLVIMGQGAAGVLSSYTSLKQIAVHTGLPCMVAALLRGGSEAERKAARASLQTLQKCASRHLGGPVRTTTISTQSPQDLQRLALQLLENAGTIQDEPLVALRPCGIMQGLSAHLARSH